MFEWITLQENRKAVVEVPLVGDVSEEGVRLSSDVRQVDRLLGAIVRCPVQRLSLVINDDLELSRYFADPAQVLRIARDHDLVRHQSFPI